jgi:hypothetical protein
VVTEASARWGLLEQMVKELPTGVAPRKELMAGHVADGRWEAALEAGAGVSGTLSGGSGVRGSVLRSNPAK